MGIDGTGSAFRKWLGWAWPWLLVLLIAAIAVWHAYDFPDDLDVEFPGVVRPTFSRLAPPAYRLAEPGDTIDRIAIYFSSVACILAVRGFRRDRFNRRTWTAALASSIFAFWYAANPGPTFDGWHGLGWATILDTKTPLVVRCGLSLSALSLGSATIWGLLPWSNRWFSLRTAARSKDLPALLSIALALLIMRLLDFPRIEPFGYWPRWAFVGSLVLFSASLLKLTPRRNGSRRGRMALAAIGAGGWLALVVSGIALTWYHRPLDRLRAVVPGRIYISAMPTTKGLEIAYDRHHFKTIINLFPEDSAFQSPRLPDELRFAKARGIQYYGSPTEVSKSNEFLDLTLRLAKDPSAWPILIHCHACMDRTPAWVGVYRYVVEGWRLDDVLRFIEGHRGYRPKASVTLLYNRVLPRLAPERYKSDEIGAILKNCAAGTCDPYFAQVEAELKVANPSRFSHVDEGESPATAERRPSLTPRR